MTQITQALKDLFLQLPERSNNTESDSVALEQAFASTLGNKSHTVRVVVVISVLLAVITAIAAFYLMRKAERDIKIDIIEFQDVELKNLADRTVDNRSELEQLNSERIALERQYRWNNSRLEADIERQIAEAKSVSAAAPRLKSIEANGAVRLEKLAAEYQRNSASINQKISAIQQTIAQDEQVIAALTAGNDIMQNSAEELNQLRLSRLRQYYEARIERLNNRYEGEIEQLILQYNPPVGSDPVGQLLNQPVGPLRLDNLSQQQRALLIGQEPQAEKLLADQQQWNRQSLDILARLRQIPFENVPQLAAVHLEDTTLKQQQEFNRLAALFGQSVQAREEKLQNYQTFVSNLLKIARAVGEIDTQIDNQTDNQQWLINPLEPVDPDSVAYAAVIDQNGAFVSAIELRTEQGQLIGKLIAPANGRPVKPQDLVVILPIADFDYFN